VTLAISLTSCNIDVTPGTLTAIDTCIEYHVTRFEASQNVILYTRYVSTCVVAGCGSGRRTKIQTKAIRCRACYYSIMLKAHRVTSMADTDIDAVKKRKNAERIKQKSSLRRIHDPVLSSLKMKGTRLLFLRFPSFAPLSLF
jgi:hypothetical protein